MKHTEMEKCHNHPDRQTCYVCSKYSTFMCEECFKCSDPEIYCKFLTSCPNQVLTKKGMLEGLSAPIHPGAMKYYKEAGLK